MFWLLSRGKIISVCLNVAELFFSKQCDSTTQTVIKSHVPARRYKFEDPFTSLLPGSEWPHEPNGIESRSSIALKKLRAHVLNQKTGLLQNDPEPQNKISEYMYYR
jgi:hypothetical protein